MDYTEVFKAIEIIKIQTELAKKEEPDDFNWGLLVSMNERCQKTLYMLTRGEEGIENHLELQVL